MIEIRKLAPEEYPLLAKIAEGYTPEPSASVALVAFDGDQPVGRMMLVAPVHVEGTWVAPECRFGTVGARLFARCAEEAKDLGLAALLAYSQSGAHDAYLHRLGFERLALTVWRKEL